MPLWGSSKIFQRYFGLNQTPCYWDIFDKSRGYDYDCVVLLSCQYRQDGGNQFSLDIIRRHNLSERGPTQDHIHTFWEYDLFAITRSIPSNTYKSPEDSIYRRMLPPCRRFIRFFFCLNPSPSSLFCYSNFTNYIGKLKISTERPSPGNAGP